MRPVNRGNPATYPADYFLIPGPTSKPVQSATILQGYIDQTDQLNQNIATIRQEIQAKGVGNSKKRKEHVRALNVSASQISASRPLLITAYQNALNHSPFNKSALASAAQDLIENIMEEIQWYRDDSKKHKQVFPAIYGQSRGDLIANIGQYCSFCEMPLAASLAIEHMLPKADFPRVALSWTNFLLACSMCNAYKNKNPSRETGLQAAISQGTVPPLTDQAIRDATLSTYLWPSDATLYRNWQTFFKFQMKKVLYNADGVLISATDIPDTSIRNWAAGNTRVTVLSESGYALNARFNEYHHNFSSTASGTILQELKKIKIDPLLQKALETLQPEYRLNFNKTNIQLIQKNDTNWQISEHRRYIIDTTIQKNIRFFEEYNGRRLSIMDLPFPKQGERNSFLSYLGRSMIPPQINTILADPSANYQVNPNTQRVQITTPDRTTYQIDVTKTINITDDGVIHVYSEQEYQLELHLVPVSGAYTAMAKTVISDLRLNHLDPSDKRFADRRMVKRTKTWFIALESVRNLSTLILPGGHFSNPGPELAALITQTAIATGFWSVWRDVFHTFLAPTIVDEISKFLFEASNFPGTRNT